MRKEGMAGLNVFEIDHTVNIYPFSFYQLYVYTVFDSSDCWTVTASQLVQCNHSEMYRIRQSWSN